MPRGGMARAGETVNDIDELSLHRDSRFWQLSLVSATGPRPRAIRIIDSR